MAGHDNPVCEENEENSQVQIDSYVIKKDNAGIEKFSLEKTEQEKKENGGSETSMVLSLSSSLLSGLYLMLIVSFSVVMKTNLLLSGDVTAVDVYWFMIFLYTVGSLWMILYQPLATSCYKQKEKMSFAKSNHVNNRWLKGVLALFGLAIIVKNGLEFIAYLTISPSLCKAQGLYATLPALNIAFLVLQVNYLFKHSKVFTQDFQVLTKFGVMHVIGTNLSVWIATVIDEAAGAINAAQDQNHDLSPTSMSSLAASSELPSDSNLTTSMTSSNELIDAKPAMLSNADTELLIYENCSCNSSYCVTVSFAEAFLYPFVIEFSLVASCLLYITWKNIGKTPPVCQYVIKPSYKLYGSYKGVIAGSGGLFATILMIVVLATSSFSTDNAVNGFQGIEPLLIYNTFYILFELIMIASCCFGFYLYKKIRQEFKEESEQLDAVLLIICLAGPLVYGMFSMFGVVLSKYPENTKWILSFILPLIDILQSIIQVIFILGGQHRKPIVSRTKDFYKKKSELSAHGIPLAHSICNLVPAARSFDERNVLKEKNDNLGREAKTNVIKSFRETESENTSTSFGCSPELLKKKRDLGKDTTINVLSSFELESGSFGISSNLETINENQASDFTKMKVVVVERVTPPDRKRQYLRDVLMFLLISNACLWIFLSLEGTAFYIQPYQDKYYGASVWMVISMICRPLNIFFRMHSAACLFEAWSFA